VTEARLYETIFLYSIPFPNHTAYNCFFCRGLEIKPD